MAWLVLAYSLACLPLAFWWCCCSRCAACNSHYPSQWQIVITGMADGTNCSPCSNLDGTYITNEMTCAFGCIGSGLKCTWVFHDLADFPFPATCPTIGNVGVRLALSDTSVGTTFSGSDELAMTLFFRQGATFVAQTIWVKNYSFPINCGLSSVSIPFFSNPNGIGACDGSAATCIVSAIP